MTIPGDHNLPRPEARVDAEGESISCLVIQRHTSLVDIDMSIAIVGQGVRYVPSSILNNLNRLDFIRYCQPRKSYARKKFHLPWEFQAYCTTFLRQMPSVSNLFPYGFSFRGIFTSLQFCFTTKSFRWLYFVLLAALYLPFQKIDHIFADRFSSVTRKHLIRSTRHWRSFCC